VKVERNKATGYLGNIWESTEICGGKMGCQLEKTKKLSDIISFLIFSFSRMTQTTGTFALSAIIAKARIKETGHILVLHIFNFHPRFA